MPGTPAALSGQKPSSIGLLAPQSANLAANLAALRIAIEYVVLSTSSFLAPLGMPLAQRFTQSTLVPYKEKVHGQTQIPLSQAASFP